MIEENVTLTNCLGLLEKVGGIYSFRLFLLYFELYTPVIVIMFNM